MPPTVFWPSALGLITLIGGLITHRREIGETALDAESRFRSLGPVFIAAALATFSGEHFSDAASLMALVPKWFPLRLATTYFVGMGLLAAAVSFIAKRAVRWSSVLLAAMFALFVALIYLPSLRRHPGVRMAWIFPFREGTFALGALCIYAYKARPSWSRPFATLMTFWTAGVLVFYGTQNVLFPQFRAGVPDSQANSAWVPQPHLIAYLTGAILIACGVAALFKRASVQAITAAAVWMTVLSVALFGPDLFLSTTAAQEVNAINFVADTLLFAGTMLVIARCVGRSLSPEGAPT